MPRSLGLVLFCLTTILTAGCGKQTPIASTGYVGEFLLTARGGAIVVEANSEILVIGSDNGVTYFFTTGQTQATGRVVGATGTERGNLTLEISGTTSAYSYTVGATRLDLERLSDGLRFQYRRLAAGEKDQIFSRN